MAIRYLFLIPLTLRWINEGVVLNAKNIALSLMSIIAVLFFSYSHFNLEPFFYQTSWATHRWICYFYLPTLLTYALWLVFNRIRRTEWIISVVKELAKSSYEIFLAQMLVFVVLPYKCFDCIQSIMLSLPLWMITTFVLSITGGIALNRLTQKVLLVKK